MPAFQLGEDVTEASTEADLVEVEHRLLPCPFCGGGSFDVRLYGRSWTGQRWSAPTSVSIRHWCPHVDGQPSPVMIERMGRDMESAIAAWNVRAIGPASATIGNMELVVCNGPNNALLAKLVDRARLLGKYTAAHPVTVERVLADLDRLGPSESGDVIHSLLWAAVEAQHRAAVMADMLGSGASLTSR